MSEGDGVTYQASLPLRWEACAVTSLELERARTDNLTLLQSLAMLESAMEVDHGEDPVMGKALERIEARMDIMLNMLATLLNQHVELPARRPVVLGARWLEWVPEATMPEMGASVLLSLYLSPRLPTPIRLYARVVTAHADRCVANFLDQDEELEDGLTRTLFRYHRRALQARHQSAP